MRCEFCKGAVSGLINLRVYTREGVKVCNGCYEVINRHRHKPYSKVMDRLAVVEAGYYVNRKVAALARGNWQTRR